MGVNPTKMRFPFDKLLELRTAAAAAITSDTGSTALALDVLGAYWNTGENAGPHEIYLVVNVSAIVTTVGDETYDLVAEVDASDAFGTPTQVGSLTVAATGMYVVPVIRENVEKKDPAATHLRLFFDVGGASPSITAQVWAATAH